MTTQDEAPPKVKRALVLSLLNTVIGKFGGFFVSLLLARLLAPEDFGVFAVALVALQAVLSLNELGVSLAIVRWQGDPRAIAPTVTTISTVSSALLYVGCWFGAPAFAEAMGSPDAVGVLRLLCVSVLIDGATATAVQLVNRAFRQGAQLAADLLNLVVTCGLTVTLALNGAGAWSLAWGQLAGNALSALMLLKLVDYWPRPGFDRRQARELLAFGLPLAAASFVVFAMLNVDYVVIGRLLDVTALGFYVVAFNLSSWPVNTFSVVMRRVSLAAFARVQDEVASRGEALTRLAVILAVPTLPVCAALGVLALPAVTTLYGGKWAAAAAVVQFLAILGVVRVFAELCYDFLVALGRSRTCLWLQVGWFGSLVVALPIGALWNGIAGVAALHALVAAVVILPAFAWMVRRTGVSLRQLGFALSRPVLGVVVMIAVMFGVRFLTDPSALQLFLGVGLGLLVYLPFVWPLRHQLRDLR